MEYHEEQEVISLLRELLDEEGPQPGTSKWAGKVKAFLRKLEGEEE